MMNALKKAAELANQAQVLLQQADKTIEALHYKVNFYSGFLVMFVVGKEALFLFSTIFHFCNALQEAGKGIDVSIAALLSQDSHNMSV